MIHHFAIRSSLQRFFWRATLACGCCLGTFGAATDPSDRAWASESSSPAVAMPTEQAIEGLCAKVKPAFVFIAGGSGVIVQPDGLMLTNTHVIENGKQFDVRLGDGRHFKAQVLGRDVIGDLAVLQLERKNEEPFPYLELGDSDALQIGEPALAVGNPFGVGQIDQHPTYTIGIISAVRQFQGRYTECIVTDAEVNPGNSGGPLVNMAGQVVGINGQISTRWGLRSNTGLGYAISARQIKLWLPLLKAAGGGNISRGRPVGLQLQSLPAESPDSVVIKSVEKGSTAETAGFQPQDRIVRWDGQPVANGFRLISLVSMYPEGYEVPVDVRRGDTDVRLTVRLVNPEQRPAPKTTPKESPKEEPTEKPAEKPSDKPNGKTEDSSKADAPSEKPTGQPSSSDGKPSFKNRLEPKAG